MAIRVQNNSEDFGRCGCGRRDFCYGSHGLTEVQWNALQATELAAAQEEESVAED